MKINKKINLPEKTSRILSNGIWMYLLQGCNSILPLITLPYITRILGPEKYGEFAIALNIIGYMQIIVEYGFGMSATRKVAVLENDEKELCKIFTCILTIRLLFFFLCCGMCIPYLYWQQGNRIVCHCVLTLLVCLIGYCLQQNWLFQGMQDMKFISLINIISRLISVLGIFILVHSSEHLLLYCFLYSITPLLSGVIGIVVAYKQYRVRVVRIKPDEIINEIKDGWYVFTTQLSSKVFSSIGVTILGIYATAFEVGIYSAVQKVVNILLLCWTPISQILYPISSQKMKCSFIEGEKSILCIRKKILIIFFLIALCVCIISRSLIGIALGEEYASYYYLLYPLLAWVLVAISNNFYGIQIMLGGGWDKNYSKCFLFGVLCTIIANYFLIVKFGMNGAAMAPLISEILLGVALYRELKKISEDEGYEYLSCK